MRFRSLWCGAALLLAAGTANAADPTMPRLATQAPSATLHGALQLSLADAIAMGLENNLGVEIQRHAPIIAHELAYDPFTDALYATGTCSQTSWVYKVPASGVPQILNPSQPLTDPDDLAVGYVPGSSAPHLFVAAQDNLYVADGAFMPSALGVNPSLTIAANAIRVADIIAGRTKADAAVQ